MCSHTSNSEPYDGRNFRNTLSGGTYINVWFEIPAKYNSYIWFYSAVSSFPSISCFKPLCHPLNLLLYLRISADENLNEAALNCPAPLLLNNWSTFRFGLSCSSCPWLFLLPPLWSLSSQSQSPSIKLHLPYSSHCCSVLPSSFCWCTCSILFHIKMLTSLSQQSTSSKYWHASPHHSHSIHKGILCT